MIEIGQDLQKLVLSRFHGLQCRLRTAHRPEMAHGDGQSDGERSGSADAGSQRVARGEDGHHQDEGDKQLDDEGLGRRHAVGRHRRAEVVVGTVQRDQLEDFRSADGAQRLSEHVQYRPDAHPTHAVLKPQNGFAV